MIHRTILLLSLLLSMFFGCIGSDDDQPGSGCAEEDRSVIIGKWGSPEFITTNTNCYQNQCLELSFELKADFTYHLVYTTYESPSNAVLREVNDQGEFTFNCSQSGNLSGRYSALTFVKGQLTMNSDSLSPREWELEWNGIQGLIIQPEYLGFDHDAFVKLWRQ
ncbi:hypothetical protein QWY85_18145 [Neolewinella lacunae]|uniref:Lipocalin-like domain-containing protein n=1 Tax=Neolewinella lacunae TaxID=1517758 RepID=A0A923TA29_9BACT|nr:hypothetical protein [Neolewinella lacunae]MBC6995713.1 hypothetical protein [Neolewinella lacunae]MDN3636594.1 hypothetical protein [Neolewinella lacunae]